MVDGENQLIEIDETTITPIQLNPRPLIPLDPSDDFDGIDGDSLIPENGIEKDIELTEQQGTTILLDKLRTAIRAGDKTIHFTIDDEDESSGQRSRRPKFEQTSDNTLSAIRTLREETEESNKNFLMSVFSRVNGKRRRRHTNYLLNRGVNIRSRELGFARQKVIHDILS